MSKVVSANAIETIEEQILECNGKGNCLSKSKGDEWKFHNKVICKHGCQLIKCPNYLICHQVAPEWMLNCNSGRCMDSKICFKRTFTFQENILCVACKETKKIGSNQPKCEHFLCISCFRASYCEENVFLPFPDFPYNKEIEELYNNTKDDPKWQKDKEMLIWTENVEFWYANHRAIIPLRYCPVCKI